MNLLEKRLFSNNSSFCVLKDVYEPSEDTFLLADRLVVKETDRVLDMGTGCGILGILAAKKAREVVALDLNPHAVQCAKINAKNNGISNKIVFLVGDLFKPIKKAEKFDVIVFNAPYIPTEEGEKKTWITRAWSGGPTGRYVIDRFLADVPTFVKSNGKILIVQSTLSNISDTLNKFKKAGFRAKIISEKKIYFETIVLIEANRNRANKRAN
jgi:release factor glutamine methyltransferase